MENQLFELKFTAKTLQRLSKKSEKASTDYKKKCKTAMEKGNMDGARIYAESAIREKNQALNYLRLSSRIDAVAQRVQTAVSMKSLTKSMGAVVSNMSSVMKTMDVEKISKVMDTFEKQFENLDLASGFMESSIATSTAQAMPVEQVDSLMMQVADEHGLEFESQLDDVGNVRLGAVGVEKKEQKEQKSVASPELSLEERLKKLTES